jgi:hypothetical protein
MKVMHTCTECTRARIRYVVACLGLRIVSYVSSFSHIVAPSLWGKRQAQRPVERIANARPDNNPLKTKERSLSSRTNLDQKLTGERDDEGLVGAMHISAATCYTSYAVYLSGMSDVVIRRNIVVRWRSRLLLQRVHLATKRCTGGIRTSATSKDQPS